MFTASLNPSVSPVSTTFITKGSAAELRTQLDLANEVGLPSDHEFRALDQRTEETAKKLGGLIKARSYDRPRL